MYIHGLCVGGGLCLPVMRIVRVQVVRKRPLPDTRPGRCINGTHNAIKLLREGSSHPGGVRVFLLKKSRKSTILPGQRVPFWAPNL